MNRFQSVLLCGLVLLMSGMCSATVTTVLAEESAGSVLFYKSTKTVTAYADSESSAMKRAEKANKGWTATKAKKTGGKKSRQWKVWMEKD